MRAAETIAGLAAFAQRGAGTDAERRAANWLADQIASPRRDARIEPFWCRPNWALTHAWHVLLGIAGSLVAVGSPRVGGAIVLVALVSLIVDELIGVSIGRRLTPEHASQNVVSTPAHRRSDDTVHLILTANYDAGRAGLAYRDALRRPAARARRALGRVTPGWLGWLAILLTWVLAIALVRLAGTHSTVIGALQLIATVGLVLALALLLELGSAAPGPAANDNASGVAATLALAAALDAAPPPGVSVELVLQGAGDVTGTGLRRHLRARRGELKAANTVVLGLAPCGSGAPRWWISDGQLVPLQYFKRLRELCAETAIESATGHRGRGATPALVARAARLPAIAIGSLDDLGLAGNSHQTADTPASVGAPQVDTTVQFGLLLVDAIAAFLRSA